VPGAQLAIHHGDETAAVEVGELEHGTGHEITRDAAFPLGSIGKSFTATVLMIMAVDVVPGLSAADLRTRGRRWAGRRGGVLGRRGRGVRPAGRPPRHEAAGPDTDTDQTGETAPAARAGEVGSTEPARCVDELRDRLSSVIGLVTGIAAAVGPALGGVLMEVVPGTSAAWCRSRRTAGK
jgi:hypothetical protein